MLRPQSEDFEAHRRPIPAASVVLNSEEPLSARKRTSANSSAERGESTHQSDRGVNGVRFVSFSEETRRRYLNYAMSVITSRALPDVRDGLKPVQRRILYVMRHELGLTADAKFVKCARIVGDTVGKYHPHSPEAVYDTLVRMAQDFTLRNPLVHGQGNFGSVIGLPPAAERYTEAKLSAIAGQLMTELRSNTVEMRSNYDATRDEPTVLPARFPNLLVNGAAGIAVGMATSIPPHNLGEVINACVHLIDDDAASVAQVMKYIKAPDFPLGGRIVTDRRELREAYEEGRGSIKVRAEWTLDKEKRKEIATRIVITSVPYGVETGGLLTAIGQIAESRSLPQLLAANDESDLEHGMRLVLDLKPGSDPSAVMTYLYRNTALEQNFAYNATALVPDEHGVLVPRRLGLVEMLRHFLDFRLETVRRRFQYQLEQLEKRIHILEGFAIIFDGLDKALKIIRASDGKQDAAAKLMKAFPQLDDVQTDAILELALYRISQLEIDRILEELEDKRKQAEEIRKILASERRLWGVVRKELLEIAEQFPSPRRTALGSSEEITEFDPQAYIVRENTNVVVSKEGWIKRVQKISSIDKLRIRDGDEVLTVVPTSTLDNLVIFASDGTAYTLPVDQIPPSTGYGEPLSKHVKLKDGAGIVNAITTDARFTPADRIEWEEFPPTPYLFIATAQGQVMRLSFSLYRLPSTKSGRRYCRLRPDDSVVHVEFVRERNEGEKGYPGDSVFLVSRNARLIHFDVSEAQVLSAPGKGVRGIKLEKGDEVLGAQRLSRPSDTLRVENENGKILSFGQMKYNVTGRGGRGVKTSHRTGLKRIIRPDLDVVDWSARGED
ncbi:MAG: DNA topoisomerase IV subunit A [Planctomycetaceae bacterium]|nr:DNA topoisomerase IV subunit A [Planctomycetaceae bacterium]